MKKILILTTLIIFYACKETPEHKVVEEKTEIVTTLKDSIANEPTAEKLINKKSAKQTKKELIAKNFEVFDYIDKKTKDTIIMQQYFMVFLKKGAIRGQNEEEAEILQKEHRAHQSKMYELGYADISGPFADNGDIRGITIYNVPTLKMADSLAKSDPMVKAGLLKIEIHPWWAGKGFLLR